MAFPIFVINLSDSTERWMTLQNSVVRSAIKLTCVEAIDGRLVSERERTDVDEKAFEKLNGRHLLPPEYGCYRSHLKALRAFVDSGAPFGVVMEDDVLWNATARQRIEAISTACPQLDVVKLVNHRIIRFMHLATTSRGDDVGRSVGGPQGSAAAYLVSRSGAEKIITALDRMSLPWDVALERSWASGVDVLSVRRNMLEFSEHYRQTNISPDGYNKFSFRNRTKSMFFKVNESVARLNYVLLGQSGEAARAIRPEVNSGLLSPITAVAGTATLLFLSAVWLESDAYRYSGLALVLIAIIPYLQRYAWTYSKPLIGYAGMVCLFWAIYVAFRFAVDVVASSERGIGSAEGIYMLPFFYPTFGYALWRFCPRPYATTVAFMLISLMVLFFTTDYSALIDGNLPIRTLHNNTIHAAAASGFLFIFSLYFVIYLSKISKGDMITRYILIIASLSVNILAIANVFALQSKGVWLAIVLSLPIVLVGVLGSVRRLSIDQARIPFLLAVALIGVITLGIGLSSPQLTNAVEQALQLPLTLLNSVFRDQGLIASLEMASTAPDIPTSVQIRLRLWLDAIEIWTANPWFGAGIDWLLDWDNRSHTADLTFNILHNSYLEIAVRYGLFGLAFYAFILIWSTYMVYRAAAAKLVAPIVFGCYLSALVYFLAINFTNSFIRLAIGETYIWFAVGFGFYCFYKLQERGLGRPRTWF